MKRDKEYYIRKALELCVAEKKGEVVLGARDAYDALRPYGMKDQEYFLVLILDGAHRVTEVVEVSKGILNKTVVHPREVFRAAIKANAAAIIIAHNHPSGQLVPSEEDCGLTKRLGQAGEVVGIAVLDHIILGHSGYFSFLESGKPLT